MPTQMISFLAAIILATLTLPTRGNIGMWDYEDKPNPSSMCTLRQCEGIDMFASIQQDLGPWRARGGISQLDLNTAVLASSGPAGDWLRITISDGKMYAKNFGTGWGMRDGMTMILLLELMNKYKTIFPQNVDLVFNPSDRARLKRPLGSVTSPKALPFALSFAIHPDHLDVGIPDPSFWGWPEYQIKPHWQLIADAPVPWESKVDKAFWRGTISRSGQIRSTLIHCQKTPKLKGLVDLKSAVKSWASSWSPPMESCKFKYAVCAQGEGFTSSKQRVLACGSLPIFVNHDQQDSFYGRWLTKNYHYVEVRNSSICDDLEQLIKWGRDNPKAAQAIGSRAKRFAEIVLGPRMLHDYIVSLLTEVARLQSMHSSRYSFSGAATAKGMVLVTKGNIAQLFENIGRGKGGIIAAELALWNGEDCPAEKCSRCCVSPNTENPEAASGSGDPSTAWRKRIRGNAWAMAANKTNARTKSIDASPRAGGVSRSPQMERTKKASWF